MPLRLYVSLCNAGSDRLRALRFGESRRSSPELRASGGGPGLLPFGRVGAGSSFATVTESIPGLAMKRVLLLCAIAYLSVPAAAAAQSLAVQGDRFAVDGVPVPIMSTLYALLKPWEDGPIK